MVGVHVEGNGSNGHGYGGVHGGMVLWGGAWVPLPLGKGAARLLPCFTLTNTPTNPSMHTNAPRLVPELNCPIFDASG